MAACKVIGISARTIERWRNRPEGDDGGCGPHHRPKNALSAIEEAQIVSVLTSSRYAGLSPKQLVPQLADEGLYLASESTMYRIQRRHGLRGQKRMASRTHVTRACTVHEATQPNQVWSWAAAELVTQTCRNGNIDPRGLVLHSDNGAPMRSSTLISTLQWLGVVPSFSRPHVSDDNPYSEALFRTLKYTPAYPQLPFPDIASAQRWVDRFVNWYNGMHRHSAIRYVTPDERHFGHEHDILARRRELYERARSANPERWSGTTRNWTPVGIVALNPERMPANAAASAMRQLS